MKNRSTQVLLVVALLAASGWGARYVRTTAEAAFSAAEAASLYYGFILSAAAIVFAVSFTSERHWPSILQISRYCYLSAWLLSGAMAASLTWLAEMSGSDFLAAVAAILWFAAAVLGTVSLVRIVLLSNVDVMTRYMSKRLIVELNAGGEAKSFNRAVREAVAQGDVLKVRDLTNQLSTIRTQNPELTSALDLQNSYTRRVVRASLVDNMEGSTAGNAIRNCLFGFSAKWDEHDDSPLLHAMIVDTAPRLARFENQARMLVEAGIASASNAIDVRDASMRELGILHLLYDPEPKQNDHPAGLVTLKLDQEEALRCYRALTLRPVHGSPSAVYSLYQHITKRRYGGDYFVGAPVLADLVRLASDESLAGRLEILIAEQLVNCTARHVDYPSHAGWYSGESRRLVLSQLRIAGGLTPLASAEQAVSSWLHNLAGLHENLLGSEGAHPRPSGAAIAVGLAMSHVVRLSVLPEVSRPGMEVSRTVGEPVPQGGDNPSEATVFLNSLPSDVATAATERLMYMFGVEAEDVLPVLKWAALAPEGSLW